MVRRWRQGAPVNLHVTHSWGGGLGRWAENFAAYDVYSSNLALSSVGTEDAYGLTMSLRDLKSGDLINSWVMRHPICEAAMEHREYRKILEYIIVEYGVDHLYISSFIGHSLDLLNVDIRTSIIYHDFFPFCQAISITFGDLCASCSGSKQSKCLGENELAFLFRQNSARYWLQYRQKYLDILLEKGDCQHICPSNSVVRYLCQLDPRYKGLNFGVIEHGIRYCKKNFFGGAEEDRRLRIVLLGRVDRFKGLVRLKRIYETLRVIADLYFVGSGVSASSFNKRFGIEFIEHYKAEDLPEHLSRIRPDLALFLPDIPETFCYTLSEAFAHCIPACAFRLGSFEDRIVSGENGVLVDLEDDDVIQALLALDRDRALLRTMSNRLSQLPVRTVEEMVGDYYRLRGDYDEVLDRCADSLLED